MSKYDPKLFGHAVHKQRLAMGLSLREIAVVLSLAPSTLHRIENGASCDVLSFLTLSEWLHKPIPELPEPCKRCHGTGLESERQKK